jgi:hypothetical protein
MATPKFATLLSEWTVLSANLQSLQPGLPASQESQEELAALIEEGKALSSEQVRLEGALKTVIAHRKELIERGNHLREHLGAALRHQLGVTSPLLAQYGLRPRGPRGPKRKSRKPSDSSPSENSEISPAES